MKIVIAGAGEVGTYLAKMLNKSNHDIIMIDMNKEKLQNISSHFDLLTVSGSASSIDVLKEAQTPTTDLFIAVTEKQETNITASILAKKIGAKRTIARVDNREYIQPENNKIIKNLGIDSLVYPEILASNEILNLVKHSGLAKSVQFSSGKLTLFAIKLNNKSPIVNLNLKEVTKFHKTEDARIVAINRGEDTIIPRGDDKLQKNDLIYIVSKSQEVEKIIMLSGVNDHELKNVMILGGSRIGVKTARHLEKDCYVKLVEKNQEKGFLIADELDETLVIHDAGTSSEFLKNEGIAKTDAFIAVTGNSEINILSCLLAKKLGANKTIAEVENQDYLGLAKNMGIDILVNKKLIAASHIYSFTINAEVLNVECFTDSDAEVLEFVVHKNSKITKKILNKTKFPKGAIIGGIVRDGKSFIAVGETQLCENDKVVVFSMPEVINTVSKLFK